MVIGIIGENCTGKSTLANTLQHAVAAEIITGKDYLLLAKSASEAAALFKEKLQKAISGAHILYVISEREQLAFLPSQAIKVLVTADLSDIKERFRARMRGNLPAPVEQMLESNHGMFDGEAFHVRYHSGHDDLDEAVAGIIRLLAPAAE